MSLILLALAAALLAGVALGLRRRAKRTDAPPTNRPTTLPADDEKPDPFRELMSQHQRFILDLLVRQGKSHREVVDRLVQERGVGEESAMVMTIGLASVVDGVRSEIGK